MITPNLDGRIELDEVLLKAKDNQRAFRDILEREEANEPIETVDMLTNQMTADRNNTSKKKLDFIKEIKTKVGKDIKKQKGYGVKFKKDEKLSLWVRFKNSFIALYSNF